jgi:hypothetical protein
MDNLVFEESLNTEIDQSEFISKKWIYVNDNNNGNYTSQVVLDSTPLSNAGGWVNWSEGFILMPLVVQLTSADATDLPFSAASDTPNGNNDLGNYTWALKNGFWNLINSMSVEFNNQNIIQQTPFVNVFRSFKAHTSFSQDDLLNEGSSIGYYPDNAGSWSYQNNSTADLGGLAAKGREIGIANNSNAPYYSSFKFGTGTNTFPLTGVAGAPAIVDTDKIQYGSTGSSSIGVLNDDSYNEGMLKRQSWVGYDGQNSITGQNLVNNAQSCGTVYRSHKVVRTQAGSIIWNVYAKLRLKDLAEFFEKTPLLKGSTMRFYMNTNQSIVKFSTTLPSITLATGAVLTEPVLNISSVNVIGGLTNPLMVSSAQVGNGCSTLPTGDYQLSVSIFKNTFSDQAAYNLGQTALTACRLYAPVYTMNPLSESKYLSLAPTRKVLYRDVFQYQFSGIAAGDNFNFLVSNGINNIKSVLVVPFISTKNTGTVLATLPYSSFLNPCSSAPATPDPIMLSNFNIMVSGINLFLNNENYDFEAFRQQLISSNQLNGSLTTGLASGLISEDMFSKLYRYYYGDCSRVLPSEQGVSRSVQVIGQNVSKLIIDIMVFVEFQREITIDVSTGARVE